MSFTLNRKRDRFHQRPFLDDYSNKREMDMRNCFQIHPLNAKGKYYFDQNACLICNACFHAPPQNFGCDPDTQYGYYVIKQPEKELISFS